MAIATWPDYASLIDDGYSDRPDFGVLRSDIPGLPTQRSRWSAPIVSRELTILAVGDERKTQFDEFVRVDLRRGSGWFRFRDPVDQVVKLGRIVNGSVQWSSPGGVWLGRCSIESIG